MKILVTSTSALPTPPLNYGGLEWIAYNFAEEAAKLGHEVIVITTNESREIGSHEAVDETGKSTGGVLTVAGAGPSGWGIEHERRMYVSYREWMEQQFGAGQGIVFDHSWFGYPYISQSGAPQFLTESGPITIAPHPDLKVIHVIHGATGLGGQKPRVTFPRLVGVSTRQAAFLSSQFGFPVRHVHNGIHIPPKPEQWPLPDDGYLLSLNRISKEKGIMSSIDVAVANGYHIKVVGDYSWVASQDYVYEVITRCEQSGGLAEFVGNVDNETKWDLIKKCKAMVACPDIRQNYVEAFGLYAVEAGIMGKPLIALLNGGLYDIIQDNVNGIVADNPEQLRQRLSLIDWAQFNPDIIRDLASRFSVENMTQNYLKLAEGVLSGAPEFRW